MSTENLSPEERALMTHVHRWGSDGYPVRKVGSRWIVDDAFGVKGPPTVYKAKRDAVAQFERWIDAMCDKSAGRR